MGALAAVTESPELLEGAQLAPVHAGAAIADHEWIPRLSATGTTRADAIERLRELLLRAARHQVGRMPQAVDLGATRRDEIVQSAANEATLSVLARLATFEGRSRFTTWAYKFGIYQAGIEVRRATWHDREVNLHDLDPLEHNGADSPEASAEGHAIAAELSHAMLHELTPHQRRVAVALLIDEVPIDVLAERLGTTRGALYKTLHDARRRLRAHLTTKGLLDSEQEAHQ